jgi:hypothetical protein
VRAAGWGDEVNLVLKTATTNKQTNKNNNTSVAFHNNKMGVADL